MRCTEQGMGIPCGDDPQRPYQLSGGPPERAAGFTLVELLVVIVVIAVLVGLLLPVLGAARRSAKHTESITISRQIVGTLRVYGTDNRDFFPAFANLGADSGGPVSIRGQVFMVSYFHAHVFLWPAAVAAGDPTVLPSIRHPMLRDQPVDPDRPETEETLFLLAAGVAAAPELFQATVSYPIDPLLLAPRKWSDVTYPSAKGLILDGYWWGAKQHSVTLAGFCDGSAGTIPGSTTPPVSPIPGTGPHAPVVSTLQGVHGRDR